MNMKYIHIQWELIKDKTQGASSRCIPLGDEIGNGKCIHCEKEAKVKIYFARSY